MEMYLKMSCRLSLFLALVIILTSCNFSKKEGELDISTLETKTENQNISMGRFVQKDITPPDLGDSRIVNFSQGANGLFLFTMYDEDKKEPKAFFYQNDIWAEQENEHATKFIKENTFEEIEPVYDFEGNWWIFIKNGEFYDRVLRISQDGSSLEIEIPEVEYIHKILISTEGMIYIGEQSYVLSEHIFIDTRSGAIIENKVPKDIIVCGISKDEITTLDEYLGNIVIYDIRFGDILHTYEIPTNIVSISNYVSEDEFVYMDREGIHKMLLGSNNVQNIIDDKSFVYSVPDGYHFNYSVCFLLQEDKYLLAIELEEGAKVYEYSYDESIPSYKSDNLSLWALEEDDKIDNAVIYFSKKHPECKVSVEYGVDYSQEVIPENYDDVIRTLNTKLLAGDVPDVLFLDGLPIETLIKRGMLSELNITIDLSEYFENIMSSYNNGEVTYAYPTSFYFYILASNGSNGDISSQNTLENIAKLYQDPKAIQMYGQVYVFDIFYDTYSHKIFPDYKTVNEEALKEFLEQTKIMVDGSDKYYELSGLFRFSATASHATVMNNPSEVAYLFLTQENVEIASLLEGTYRNENIVSIPVDAKNKALAQEFITMMLTDDMNQIKSFAAKGFSVKKEVNWINASDMLQGIPEYDPNSNIEFNKGPYEDFCAVDWDGIIGNLQYSSSQDYVAREIVYEEAVMLYEGQTLNVDTAVSHIMNKLNILFAERN